MSSSLFTQLLNKNNIVLSDEDDDKVQNKFIDPPIKLRKHQIKEKQASLYKVQSKSFNSWVF